LWSRPAQGKKQDPIFKITRAKRAGGMAQTAKHLPSKQDILSSENSSLKNKKQKQLEILL
jgi:hypothetical protein